MLRISGAKRGKKKKKKKTGCVCERDRWRGGCVTEVIFNSVICAQTVVCFQMAPHAHKTNLKTCTYGCDTKCNSKFYMTKVNGKQEKPLCSLVNNPSPV